MNIQDPRASDLDLAAYLDGRLTADERKRVDRRLATDAAYPNTLEMVQAILNSHDDLPPAEEVPERLIRKAAAFYPHSHDLLDLVLAFAGDSLRIIRASLDVRIAAPLSAAQLRTKSSSDASIVVMTKSFEACSAEVHLEKLSGNTCNIAIQVTDRLTRTLAKNLRIDLVYQWRELASNPLQNGRVLFEAVKCGTYDVIIKKRGASCGAMRIKII